MSLACSDGRKELDAEHACMTAEHEGLRRGRTTPCRPSTAGSKAEHDALFGEAQPGHSEVIQKHEQMTVVVPLQPL